MPKKPEVFRPAKLKTRSDKDLDRPNAAARGYCGKPHRNWRKAVLVRSGFRCVQCGSPHRLHADHIKPIAAGGDRYDVENGQALCHSCHSKKTAAEVGWVNAEKR